MQGKYEQQDVEKTIARLWKAGEWKDKCGEGGNVEVVERCSDEEGVGERNDEERNGVGVYIKVICVDVS